MQTRNLKTLIFLIYLLSISLSTFSQEDLGGELFNLIKIQDGIKNRRVSSTDTTGGNLDWLSSIKPGDKALLADIKGAGIINHIWITIDPSPGIISRNDIIIRMYWDGNDYPSVESPIGPFFGQGWNEQYDFVSLPLSAAPLEGTGLSCYFNMPFEKGARIEIENQTDKTIYKFYYYIDYLEIDKMPDKSGRFHAWYNHELTNSEQLDSSEKGNYVFVNTKGKGHFVGINYYVHSPITLWYGEGDDMWFIDGEVKPSLIGTGTEDFFNTAWGPKNLYSHPYFGYSRINNDVGWLGRTHIYRFFISDPIFFEKELKGTIEHGTNNDLMLDLGSVAYWYQDEAVALPLAPTKEQRKLLPLIGPTELDLNNWKDVWRNAKENNK